MAAPKLSTIVLLLVLVALVAFFVVGVALGAGDKPAPSRDQRLALRDKLFGKPKPVDRAELSATGCQGDPKAPLVRPGVSCQVRIQKGKSLLRSMKVRTRDGMHLVYTPEGKAKTPISVNLRAGQDNKVELSIQRDGGQLALTCQAPLAAVQGCVVTLE